MTDINRCQWCSSDELYQTYHDTEWGVPTRDEHTLFEFLLLEGAQAGLSWITILKKRENYRAAFNHFDAHKMAAYDQTKIDQLLQNPGIVRNKLKVNGFVKNARAYLAMLDQGETLADFVWRFTDNKVIQNDFETLESIPSETDISLQMSKALKKRGFTFVGPTICYAFMQAIGMVNDHTSDCFRYEACKNLS